MEKETRPLSLFEYCDMTDNVVVTVISQDSVVETVVQGNKESDSYTRVVKYKRTNKEQLTALTDISANCDQFIRYKFYRSILLSTKLYFSMAGGSHVMGTRRNTGQEVTLPANVHAA